MTHPDATLRAYWSSEDLTVVFRGRAERTDYGVPGSPVFTVIEDIEIEELEILGVQVRPEDLPAPLLSQIHQLADGLDW